MAERRWNDRRAAAETILVVGLGRFGSALAQALEELGHEVLAIDSDPALVQRHSGRLTHVVQADATDEEALSQLGVVDVAHAVVAIGADIEASVLATAALFDLGVEDIWAKAITEPHARILERVGARRVVFPERDTGRRTARLVSGQLLDYVQLDEGFVLVECAAPPDLVGRSLREASLRERFGVTVVCIKPEGQGFTYATPDTPIGSGDLLVVAGDPESAKRFEDHVARA